MPLTITRPSPILLPPLAPLLLDTSDVPGYRVLFTDQDTATNDALADRALEPEHRRRQLEQWGRVDGVVARFVPSQNQRAGAGKASQPIVIDTSAARFQRAAGALQALTDDEALRNMASGCRLFPRNVADNTEGVHEVFEEDGFQFDLYRMDFRVGNVLGSIGAVWRRPHGSPLEVLQLAERQTERIRRALRAAADASSEIRGTRPGAAAFAR